MTDTHALAGLKPQVSGVQTRVKPLKTVNNRLKPVKPRPRDGSFGPLLLVRNCYMLAALWYWQNPENTEITGFSLRKVEPTVPRGIISGFIGFYGSNLTVLN